MRRRLAQQCPGMEPRQLQLTATNGQSWKGSFYYDIT